MDVRTKQRDAVASGKGPKAGLVIAGVVLALFAILLAKGAAETRSPSGGATPGGTQPAESANSLTSVHNDAAADYETARKTGKPIYVLFHSLTCQPCVEISAIADKVVPAYQDKIAFVNAITDDPSAQQLASKFSFQYIPTSFFLKSDGAVADSFTGVLSEAEMKARLEKLAAE